ncbi:hypothetical protein QTP86_033531, partial [Hemibagrus guttatus]
MGKRKHLSEFDKGQIVMARPLDQSISKTLQVLLGFPGLQWQADGGSVMVWAMFCWETLGPAIHVDATLTCTTYLSIVADHVHPFMETAFPDGFGLFQQDNAPCHKTKMFQEWFDEHNNEFEMLTWPPNFPYLNPIEHLWDVLDKQVQSMEASPRNLQDLMDLMLTSWCQIPQHTFMDLVESMPRQ